MSHSRTGKDLFETCERKEVTWRFLPKHVIDSFTVIEHPCTGVTHCICVRLDKMQVMDDAFREIYDKAYHIIYMYIFVCVCVCTCMRICMYIFFFHRDDL